MATPAGVILTGWTRQPYSPQLNGFAPSIPLISGFPTAETTGYSGSLTPSSGITTSSNGQVIENLSITGRVTVQHENVTIRNCLIDGNWDFWGVFQDSGSNLLIEDCEIIHSVAANVQLAGGSAVIRRCNIHTATQDLLKMGSNHELRDSYLHTFLASEESHNDCIQISGPCTGGCVIDGNAILVQYQDQNAAIIIKSDFGNINDVTVSNNFMSGGAYTMYSVSSASWDAPTNINVSNNIFDINSAVYGAIAFEIPSTGSSWTNNAWSDGTSVASPL